MQTGRIIESLARQTSLLDNLDQSEVVAVLNCCTSGSFTNTEVIYNEDSSGNNLFIVITGSVLLKKNGQTLEIMRPGDCFGEIGAVSDEKRVYTAEAYGEVVTLSIYGEAIDGLTPVTQIKVLKNILHIISARFSKRMSLKDSVM